MANAQDKKEKMDWLKTHADTVVIVSAILASVFWMNGKFSDLEKDMAIVKTVLVLKNVMPSELAKVEGN